MSFRELQDLGRKKVAAPEPPKPSDLSTIMYTSGTTGPSASKQRCCVKLSE
jgi:long-subunit acyl-CoA synthetase (AMP-forming)